MSGSDPKPLATNSLWTAQTIMGLFGMTIVAGTVAAIFLVGDKPTIAQTVGGVMTLGGSIIGFYFGSSKGSQDKDATAAPPPSLTPGSTPQAFTRTPPPLPPSPPPQGPTP